MSFEHSSFQTAPSTLAALPSDRQVEPRSLGGDELRLIETLLTAADASQAVRCELQHAQVEPMKDGGMGSLRFIYDDAASVGQELLTATAMDEDGVPIEITFNLDRKGRLYELDLWKVDFSPLRRFPEISQVTIKG